MSIIINDLEIIPGSSGDERSSDEASSDAPSPSPSLRPIDVLEIVDRDKRRAERLRAH